MKDPDVSCVGGWAPVNMGTPPFHSSHVGDSKQWVYRKVVSHSHRTGWRRDTVWLWVCHNTNQLAKNFLLVWSWGGKHPSLLEPFYIESGAAQYTAVLQNRNYSFLKALSRAFIFYASQVAHLCIAEMPHHQMGAGCAVTRMWLLLSVYEQGVFLCFSGSQMPWKSLKHGWLAFLG